MRSTKNAMLIVGYPKQWLFSAMKQRKNQRCACNEIPMANAFEHAQYKVVETVDDFAGMRIFGCWI